MILFIDDDRFYADRWIERLRSRYEVQHFTDADAAIAFIRTSSGVRGIVLDVMMPVPESATDEETSRGYDTGLWLLEQIGQWVADNEVPVIVLTNRDPEHVVERVNGLQFAPGLVVVRKKLDTNRDRLLSLLTDMVTRWHGGSR
jgi:CheY-like chemotaxis protein